MEKPEMDLIRLPKRALLSAFTKDEALAEFAKKLRGLGIEIVASSGTKAFLDRFGIESVDVASIVGEPILGHRVVTLSREVHAGILSDLGKEEDSLELQALKIMPFGLVFVSLYPLAEELENPEKTAVSLRNKIDIGGPAMLRAAAKGERLVVSSPSQFDSVLEVLEHGTTKEGMPLTEFALELAIESESLVADYGRDTASAYRWMRDKLKK